MAKSALRAARAGGRHRPASQSKKAAAEHEAREPRGEAIWRAMLLLAIEREVGLCLQLNSYSLLIMCILAATINRGQSVHNYNNVRIEGPNLAKNKLIEFRMTDVAGAKSSLDPFLEGMV